MLTEVLIDLITGILPATSASNSMIISCFHSAAKLHRQGELDYLIGGKGISSLAPSIQVTWFLKEISSAMTLGFETVW